VKVQARSVEQSVSHEPGSCRDHVEAESIRPGLIPAEELRSRCLRQVPRLVTKPGSNFDRLQHKDIPDLEAMSVGCHSDRRVVDESNK
jgi:hypothetical protein